jgi:hypothetical protein
LKLNLCKEEEEDEYVLALLLLHYIGLVRVVRKSENKAVFIVKRMTCKRWNYKKRRERERESIE